MSYNKRILISFTTAFAVISIFLSGCTPPTYYHSITHKYDANGKLIGIEETESITQTAPFSSPMKVKITQKNKLEK